MDASTSTPILFSAHTPEPLTAIPVEPAAMAADPDSTRALISWLAIAAAVRLPAASMLESVIKALTSVTASPPVAV